MLGYLHHFGLGFLFSNTSIQAIFHRTDGHCHFCGDPLILEKYGCKDVNDSFGAWEADHVIQRAKGGKEDETNCLPACVRCNALRWHRKGDELRDLLLLGLVANDQIKKGNHIGQTLILLRQKRLANNEKRRRKPFAPASFPSLS